MAQRIYLDHAAATPMRPEAIAAVEEGMRRWANPNSPHAEGRAARAALEEARSRIAAALRSDGKIIFTSGASEALAIALGRAKARQFHISSVEHDAVLRGAPDAERLPVDPAGLVLMPKQQPSREGPGAGLLPSQEHDDFFAVQHANNETGVLQPLDGIASWVRERGGILLADCAQTAGKLPLPEADLIAVSAHKFGGPPGIGALLVRDFALLQPIGGQEHGYRAGTENLPAILGFVAALEAAEDWMDRAAVLRRRLEDALTVAGGEVVAADAQRIPTIGAYRMPGVSNAAQLVHFDRLGISVSAGSACSSGSLKPSHVLRAMGWEEAPAREVIRVSFGPETHEREIDAFVAAWIELATRRRAA